MKLGLIGYGAIGQALVQKLAERRAVSQVLVLVRPGARRPPLPVQGRFVYTIQDLVLGSDFVVEAAGPEAVTQFISVALGQGLSCLIASVGALANASTEADLRKATLTSTQLLIPSGALGGIDMAAALGRDGLTEVSYEGRKPPKAWLGSPADQLLDLNAVTTPQVIFDGTARQAALAFPKNANVAATLALATRGFDDTRVRLIADPNVAGNCHHFTAEGPAAKMQFQITAKPSAANPKSSQTVILSLLRAIENRTAAIVI